MLHSEHFPLHQIASSLTFKNWDSFIVLPVSLRETDEGNQTVLMSNVLVITLLDKVQMPQGIRQLAGS